MKTIPLYKTLKIYLGMVISLKAFASSPQEIVVLGPEPVHMTKALAISAEMIEVRGLVVTHGHSLTLLARNIEFAKDAKIVAFDGPQSEHIGERPSLPAPGVAGHDEGGAAGAAGEPGYKGLPGHEQAQPIFLYAANLIGKLQVDGNGQTGGVGGTGQRGQDGGQGGQGKSAEANGSKLWFNKGPSRGRSGGRGGVGGAGGEGGDGGGGADVNVYFGKHLVRGEQGQLMDADEADCVSVCAAPGQGGAGGAPGPNGSGGAGGAGGQGRRILWKHSGNGETGHAGETPPEVAASGVPGKASEKSGNIVVAAAYQGITQSYRRAESALNLINQIKASHNVLNDLEVNFSSDSLDEAGRAQVLGVAKFRINKIRRELSKLKAAKMEDVNLQSILDSHQQFLQQIDDAIVQPNRLSTEQGRAALSARSTRILETAYRYGVPYLKDVAQGVVDSYEGLGEDGDVAKVVAVNAYQLFGPQALEELVNNPRASLIKREDFKMAAELETRISGAEEIPAVQVQKIQEQLHTLELEGNQNVIP